MTNQPQTQPPTDDEVRAYMALVESIVGTTFVTEGMPLDLCGTIQGPQTITVSLRLYQSTSANHSRVKSIGMRRAIESALRRSPARIYYDQGLIYVEIPSPWPMTVDGTALRGKDLIVPLGTTTLNIPTGIDFLTDPHLIIVGPTRRGKTTAMRMLAYHLASQNHPGKVAFIATTFKPDDWEAFGNIAHCWDVITDPQEAAQMIDWLYKTTLNRAKNKTKLPALFVFVDDLLNLLGVADVGKTLGKIASLGAATGIHLVLASQRLGERGVGDAIVTANIPARLVFWTANAADAAYYTGVKDSGAELIGTYIGDSILRLGGSLTRLTGGYVSDAHLCQLKQNTARYRYWIGADTGAPLPTPAKPGELTLAATGAPVHQPESPLLNRQPTPEDVEQLRQIYARTGSKNKVYELCGVAKNPLRAAWLTQAIGV